MGPRSSFNQHRNERGCVGQYAPQEAAEKKLTRSQRGLRWALGCQKKGEPWLLVVRNVLSVDRKLKTQFESSGDAMAVALRLKQASPMLQVEVFDATARRYTPVAAKIR